MFTPIPLRSLALVAALVAAAGTARAQTATVAPGMSRDEVVRALGKPTGERTAGEHRYLFYGNGCEKTCGTADVVTLDGDRVVDAVFRSPRRHYSGNSSSPVATKPAAPGHAGSVLDVPPSAGAATAPSRARVARGRQVRAAARPAVGPTRPGEATDAGQTRALMVAPRRQASGTTVGTDSGVPPRALADTTTSTGTRFGPPLTVAPGPRTPQTPGIGAPPSRDSTIRNGVQLPPGSVPVPFQGARPNPVDSARLVNEQRQRAPQTSPAQPARAPR